jgi:hypothetical protein
MTAMGSRKGVAPASTVLMLLAFATMAGFLYWLNMSAKSQQVAVNEAAAAAAAAKADFAGVVALTPDSFGVDPAAYSGRTVTISNLPVSGLLGSEAFFVNIEAVGNYLVKLGADPIADGLLVFTGDVVSVTGVVAEMSEELAASWVEAGAIGAGEDMVAMINPTFITATMVEISTPAEGDDTGGDGGQ